MFDNMKIGTRLVAGFTLVIVLIILMTGRAFIEMRELSALTNSLYKHPFAVSTSVLRIKQSIEGIHHSMRDVALAATPEQLDSAVAKVDKYENSALKHFAVLNERFIGDKIQVKKLTKAFVNWKPLRTEVILLIRKGKKNKAKEIVERKGSAYISELNNRLSSFEELAFLQAEQFNESAKSQGNAAMVSMLLLLSIVIVLAIAISWIITRSVIRHIGGEPKEIEEITQRVAGGDLSIQFINTNSETGIYSAMSVMVSKIRSMINHIADSAQSQAAASEKLSTITALTKQNVLEQGSSTELVVAAIDQMQSTSKDVAKNTNTAADATKEAQQLVEQGNAKAKQTSSDIQELANDLHKTSKVILDLAESSEDISDILGVIKGIADQTNLLALNAAIEAARAGDQGRGFAVVADEVRKLAQSTQESTAEIEEKITKVQEGARASVASMDMGHQKTDTIVDRTVEVQTALSEINEAVRKVMDMNSQIATASLNQSAAATDVGKQVIKIRELSAQTGVGAEQIDSSAEDLARLAIKLNDQVAKFKM